jgi:hypothetical protein
VEGRSAENRAEEFGRLNYLLQYRMNAPEANKATETTNEASRSTAVEALELEALALELELELLNF